MVKMESQILLPIHDVIGEGLNGLCIQVYLSYGMFPRCTCQNTSGKSNNGDTCKTQPILRLRDAHRMFFLHVRHI